MGRNTVQIPVTNRETLELGFGHGFSSMSPLSFRTYSTNILMYKIRFKMCELCDTVLLMNLKMKTLNTLGE